MRIMLNKGETLEVEFLSAEEIFEITLLEDNSVVINQTAGWNVYPLDYPMEEPYIDEPIEIYRT